MKHTPGPWKADNHIIGDGWRVFVPRHDEADQHDAIADVETWQSDTETEANARLIAAAPDLLDALKNVLDELHKHHKMNVKKDYSLMVADSVARKAIAKAEGRS